MNPENSESRKDEAQEKPTPRLILLAEDDLDDQELLIETIATIDNTIHIHCETNGNKAIAYLDRLTDDQLPQLIVLDYNLPEINGAEVLELLQKTGRYQDIPKIVWSTSNSVLYKTKCLELGAKAYMVKPSDIHSIRHMAQQMLELCNITA